MGRVDHVSDCYLIGGVGWMPEEERWGRMADLIRCGVPRQPPIERGWDGMDRRDGMSAEERSRIPERGECPREAAPRRAAGGMRRGRIPGDQAPGPCLVKTHMYCWLHLLYCP